MSTFFSLKPKQTSHLKSGDKIDISSTIKLAIGVRGRKQYNDCSMHKKKATSLIMNSAFLNLKKTKASLVVCTRKLAKKITWSDRSFNQQSDNKYYYYSNYLFWPSNLLSASIQSVKDKKFFRPEDKSLRKGVYGNGKNGDYSPTLGSRKLMVATCMTALISRILAVYAKPYAKTKALVGTSRYPTLNKAVSLINRYGPIPIYSLFYQNRPVLNKTNNLPLPTPSPRMRK